MAVDRAADLIALARELERRDADVAARIDAVAGGAAERRRRPGARRPGARPGSRRFPAEIEQAELAERDARGARGGGAERARRRRATSSRRSAARGGRVRMRRTTAERAVRRAAVAAADAATTVARARERLEAARRGTRSALRAEAEGLAVEAREVARRGRRRAAPLRIRAARCRDDRSTRSRSGGRGRTRRSSSSAAASRASASGSCWRRTRWRRPRSASRPAARASRSCGGGSRSRCREATPGSRLDGRPPTGRSGSFGRRSSEPPLRQPGGQAVVEAGDARVGEVAVALGAHQRPRRGRVEPEPLARARRPPAARSTPSRPRSRTPRRWVASWASTVIANAASSRAPTRCSNAIRYSERQIVGSRKASARGMNATPAASEPTPVKA